MKIPLSNRLLCCCGFIRPGDRVADVGCDHGYLGIYLLRQGLASWVLASDVNPQPLHSAVVNARKFGVADQMQFYLSNGVRDVPRRFDVLVCAGMGADTMISIMEDAPWLKSGAYRLILQCQSRRPELCRYLYAQGYHISRERLAQDGRFIYPVMEVVYGPSAPLSPGEAYLSPALLVSGDPLLPAYCHRVCDGLRRTVAGLSKSGGDKYQEYAGILEELETYESKYKEATQ